MWLAATTEHLARSALILTKPTCMRAKVFRLFILTASRMVRVRSVRWLPSLRTKEQKSSMSLTAYSLPLRSVNVTRAFEPSPPLRQDCDEILSPSTGEVSAGVIASAGIVVASAGGADGLTKDPSRAADRSCAASVASDCSGSIAAAVARRTCWLSAVLLAEPGNSIHAPSPTIRTAGNQTNFDVRLLLGVSSGRPEKLRLIPATVASRASPVNSSR